MNKQEKWQFVGEDKECCYCFEDLALYPFTEDIVTKCPECERSFVD